MPTWIECEGLVNLRDVGGLPAGDGGRIAPGRLLRSDNLQDLTPAGVDVLARLGVSDVVDLRSDIERHVEGDGPLVGRDGIRFHELSFFVEDGATPGTPHAGELPGESLPWAAADAVRLDLGEPVASSYAQMAHDRTDSVVGALRAIAHADGAALVHCAAGKDRTGLTVALALELCGVSRGLIVDDYVATTERIAQIVARLQRRPAYADSLRDALADDHAARPEAMVAFLGWVDAQGGPEAFLARAGWTPADTAALRERLLG